MGTESKSKNDGNGGGSGEALSPAVKKVVQSVKEIVNCTEQEIYAVLKECDMDPNLAVEKLIAQGFSLFFSLLRFFRLRSFLLWRSIFFLLFLYLIAENKFGEDDNGVISFGFFLFL